MATLDITTEHSAVNQSYKPSELLCSFEYAILSGLAEFRVAFIIFP